MYHANSRPPATLDQVNNLAAPDRMVSVGVKVGVSALQPVINKVGSLIETEISYIWNVDDNLKKLQVTYYISQDLLAKLDSLHINKTTSALEGLLHDLNRYCYNIEDIVDDLDLSFPTRKVRNSILKSGRLNVPHQIGELLNKLQDLNSMIEKLLLAGTINPVQSQNGGRALYSKSLYDKTSLVDGTSRDQDKRNIISKLISEQSKHYGVSIIGMDGLGKTSLAQNILDDEKTKEHFPLILSACVSGHFQMEDVVQKLVRDHSPLTLEQIDCSKRTLIILDDIWSVTDEEWDYFKSNYLSSRPHWKILTTTRNPKVAEVTESHSFYLDRMTDEDCKKLIQQRVISSKFECEIGSKDIEVIAKKCLGIPILANKVGLKLSKKQTRVERKNYIIQLKMNELWDSEEFREVFPSLNLNEPKLPPDLKRCFAYCSLFPSGHEFNKDDLIQLWEIEGFTQSPQTERFGQGMNHGFEDLLSRSILQPSKSTDGKQTVYKMHEFNHGFAHLLTSTTICRLGEGTTNLISSSRSLRHLSIACDKIDETLLGEIGECEGLRTLLLLHQSAPIKRVVSNNFLQKLQRLRLLDLSHTNFSNLPRSKFPSKHLRFLDLSYSLITKLPKSVCSIPALQILKLKGCSKLLKISKHFHNLTNLTHLHMEMKLLTYLPSNIGKLTKLEVLDSFSVRKDDSCRVVELRGMNYLKEIHILELENIRNTEEVEEIMLSKKVLLRILVLDWKPVSKPPPKKNERNPDTVDIASDVLKSLEPHNDLDDLVVRNYTGKNFPKWLGSPSSKIASFKLENCPNCEGLPSLSELRYLTNLVFCSIHKVETLDGQFCGNADVVYPCLEFLEFRDMKVLEKWTGLKSKNMPRLSSLKIVECPKLSKLPSFNPLESLIYLEIDNCPELLSLPELPSSMSNDFGELVITDSNLVAISCKPEGDDWPKIKDIAYVEIDGNIITKSSTPLQENTEGTLSMDEQQPSMLVNGNSVTQQTREAESKISNSKGKQKVDEGSSSNQFQVAKTPFQNEITEQPKDTEPTNEAQLTLPFHESTNTDATEDMEPKEEAQLTSPLLKSTSLCAANEVMEPPTHLRRRRSPFFRKYLFGCGSSVE